MAKGKQYQVLGFMPFGVMPREVEKNGALSVLPFDFTKRVVKRSKKSKILEFVKKYRRKSSKNPAQARKLAMERLQNLKERRLSGDARERKPRDMMRVMQKLEAKRERINELKKARASATMTERFYVKKK